MTRPVGSPPKRGARRPTSVRLSQAAEKALLEGAAKAGVRRAQYLDGVLTGTIGPARVDARRELRALSERATRARATPSARRTALRSLVATARALGEVSRSASDPEHRSELRLAIYLLLQLVSLVDRTPPAHGAAP